MASSAFIREVRHDHHRAHGSALALARPRSPPFPFDDFGYPISRRHALNTSSKRQPELPGRLPSSTCTTNKVMATPPTESGLRSRRSHAFGTSRRRLRRRLFPRPSPSTSQQHSLFGCIQKWPPIFRLQGIRYATSGMPTGCLRGDGCLTRAKPLRRGAARLPQLPREVHTWEGRPYTVFGYKAKQSAATTFTRSMWLALCGNSLKPPAGGKSTTSGVVKPIAAPCSRPFCPRVSTQWEKR